MTHPADEEIFDGEPDYPHSQSGPNGVQDDAKDGEGA